MSSEREWQPIESAPPCKTLILWREGDLYPVVGWRTLGYAMAWILEEGGPEDGEHREYPTLAYSPTHWMHLPALPAPPVHGDENE